MPVRPLWLLLLLTVLLAWSGTPARALALDRRIDQLHHTAWIARDGAPTEISAIAQTADGFLWLGTAAGLYRFDGLSFERVDLFPHGGGLGLSQNIASLTVGPDGALWIGFRLGGVMRLADGDVAGARWYGLEQGLPVGTVFDVQPDRQGQVWAGTSRGLFLLRGDRWVLQGRPRAWTSVSWTAGPGPRRHAVGERAGRRWYMRPPGATASSASRRWTA
jgi:ligand-binding sensor domain-containing protein